MIKIPLLLAAALLLLASNPVVAVDGLSPTAAAQLAIKMRDTCKTYVNNGERFWTGAYKDAADAPGLVLVNKEIKSAVRRSKSADEAREVGYQKCLDFVFNNENSKQYAK